MTAPLDDITIARQAKLQPIENIASKINIPTSSIYRYGPYKAKIDPQSLNKDNNKKGKLVLVTAISPTPAGEGKTTTTIGLGDALSKVDQKIMICLREPSLGPCFGMKGGAAGGGKAQVAPMDEINLHFTGDFHAITSSNNLLSAMIDNHIYWGNKEQIDPSKISWRRVMDMNDRALRQIVVALGNNGQTREDGFDISVASEVMAIFCLATSLKDLEKRLGNIIIGQRFDKSFVKAKDVFAQSAMTALLRDAFQPNLVQTLEGTPTLIHGGPFANIAHGCNSVIATNTALDLADIVVTEAGFGADLGAEKFLNIKCRQAGLKPDAIVLVATVRALKMHGGVSKDKLNEENSSAVANGMKNLLRHIENLQKFDVPVIVAINKFTLDTQDEMDVIHKACNNIGINAHFCNHWAEGGDGAITLAKDVVETVNSGKANYKPLYKDELSLEDKIKTVATEIYHAKDINLTPLAKRKLAMYEEEGYGNLPVCIAKTQYSFSTDAKAYGAPTDHTIPVRDVRLSAGAGFIVAICGDIMTMPGLGRTPAAHQIHVNDKGLIDGLF